MNNKHADINKILPYGEQLRGFVNQNYISSAELNRILKERGIFPLNPDKEFTAPLIQTLLLSPKEFDKIRDCFSTKEDNKKIISRDIRWNDNIQLYSSDSVNIDVEDFIKKKLPTCTLERPIRLVRVNNNPNHLKAEFTITRKDINKAWYEQTNVFKGALEFINDNNGKGRVIISHTATETKQLAEFAVKKQVRFYKQKGLINENEELRRIIFNEFTNEERFAFFYRLTTHLNCEYFSFENIKDISIKPEDTTLPEEINWMENMNKMLLSGSLLHNKFFMKDKKYHKHLILWTLLATFSFNYKGYTGSYSVSFGFPEFNSGKKMDAEFELHISSITCERLDSRTRRLLKADMLSEMDKQKSLVYNNFLEYKKSKIQV